MTIIITIARERTVATGPLGFATQDVEDEFEVTANCVYHPSHRGARDSCGGVRGAGPALEPDEAAEIEINEVLDKDGNEVELTKAEEQRVIEAGFAMLESAE